MTPLENRLRIAGAQDIRRNLEAACALDFLVYGDGAPSFSFFETEEPSELRAIRHADRCVHGTKDPCSRNYELHPYPEAEPSPSGIYEGSGIGALYGIPGADPRLLVSTAGWSAS